MLHGINFVEMKLLYVSWRELAKSAVKNKTSGVTQKNEKFLQVTHVTYLLP